MHGKRLLYIALFVLTQFICEVSGDSLVEDANIYRMSGNVKVKQHIMPHGVIFVHTIFQILCIQTIWPVNDCVSLDLYAKFDKLVFVGKTWVRLLIMHL